MELLNLLVLILIIIIAVNLICNLFLKKVNNNNILTIIYLFVNLLEIILILFFLISIANYDTLILNLVQFILVFGLLILNSIIGPLGFKLVKQGNSELKEAIITIPILLRTILGIIAPIILFILQLISF